MILLTENEINDAVVRIVPFVPRGIRTDCNCTTTRSAKKMSETSLSDHFVKQIYGDCARGGARPLSYAIPFLSLSLSLPRAENVIPAGKKPTFSQLYLFAP